MYFTIIINAKSLCSNNELLMDEEEETMNNFSKKKKIIAGVLISVIIGVGYYYIYSKDSDFEVIGAEDNKLNNEIENIKNDVTKDNNATANNAEEERILVHISGAVNSEGVVELIENSRVSDAIEKAGGLREDANIKDINLAYKLEDGMKIYIPNNAEQEEKEKKNNVSNEMTADNTKEYITVSEQNENEKMEYKSFESSKVNINTATQTELETLPGIGPSTALKIINYRKENGEFKSIEDIKEISGIGEAKFANIKEFIVI